MDIRVLSPADADKWDTYVKRSRMSTPFHCYDALNRAASESASSVYPLVGYVGHEPFGVFPVFESRNGLVRQVYSPPSRATNATLGPALINVDILGTRKAETRNATFIDHCIEWIETELSPDRISVTCSSGYDDVRPFVWNGFDLELYSTYIIDLEKGRESIRRDFSKEVRRGIDRAKDVGCEISIGDRQDAVRIVDHLFSRLDSLDVPTGGSRDATVAYLDVFADYLRPFVCTIDDEYVGGMLVLEFGETLYCWRGGAAPLEDVPANDLLDWRIIEYGIDTDVKYYDLFGAMDRRSEVQKAKYGPELVHQYSVERRRPMLDIVGTIVEYAPFESPFA